MQRLEAAFGPDSARWLHRLAHGMDEEEVGPGPGCWLLAVLLMLICRCLGIQP